MKNTKNEVVWPSKTVIQKVAQTLANLKGRWADEKDYEDFKTYKTFMSKYLVKSDKTLKMVNLTKAFCLTFNFGTSDKLYTMKLNRGKVSLIQSR